jgi:hypothetical protein
MGLLLMTSFSSYSQSKKKKKDKKSKAVIEQPVLVPENSKENSNSTIANPNSNSKEITPTTEKKPTEVQQTPDKKPVEITNAEIKPINFEQIIQESKPVVTDKPNGSINWTQQYVEAKGFSVMDNVKFTNPAQAKAMARRGATVDAQRNLLEIVKGVQVTGETTVNDMIATSDFIYTKVDGIIKGAQIVGEPIEKDGGIEVKMRVPLYETNGIASAVYDKVPAIKSVNALNDALAQVPPEIKDQVLQGLAFNFNGKKIDPSMFPVIVDENNNLVLDLSKIYDPKNGKFPQLLSSTEEIFKEIGFNKGLQMLNVIKAESGRIVIDNESIKKVNWGKIGQTVSKIGKFLLMLI